MGKSIMTVDQFNAYYCTALAEDMTFEEVVENVESTNTEYFYISMCEDDVSEAVNEENRIDLKEIHIEDVGVHIALYS